MSITPKNLMRHELIGLEVIVSKSSNKFNIGIQGQIVDETKNVMVIKTDKGNKKIQKKDSEFIFTIPDGKKVKVSGSLLLAKPEDRIKIKIKKW